MTVWAWPCLRVAGEAPAGYSFLASVFPIWKRVCGEEFGSWDLTALSIWRQRPVPGGCVGAEALACTQPEACAPSSPAGRGPGDDLLLLGVRLKCLLGGHMFTGGPCPGATFCSRVAIIKAGH